MSAIAKVKSISMMAKKVTKKLRRAVTIESAIDTSKSIYF